MAQDSASRNVMKRDSELRWSQEWSQHTLKAACQSDMQMVLLPTGLVCHFLQPLLEQTWLPRGEILLIYCLAECLKQYSPHRLSSEWLFPLAIVLPPAFGAARGKKKKTLCFCLFHFTCSNSFSECKVWCFQGSNSHASPFIIQFLVCEFHINYNSSKCVLSAHWNELTQDYQNFFFKKKSGTVCIWHCSNKYSYSGLNPGNVTNTK